MRLPLNASLAMPLPSVSPSSSLKDMQNHTKTTGIELWRDDIFFKKGEWNTVEVSVRLNTPSLHNGMVKLTVNGLSREHNQMIFRLGGDMKLEGVMVTSWFDGLMHSKAKHETSELTNFYLEEIL